MSVRNGLLALLSSSSHHGYELKKELEERTGALWELNVGQVYTTLGRMVRDGLVTGSPGLGVGLVAGGDGLLDVLDDGAELRAQRGVGGVELHVLADALQSGGDADGLLLGFG